MHKYCVNFQHILAFFLAHITYFRRFLQLAFEISLRISHIFPNYFWIFFDEISGGVSPKICCLLENLSVKRRAVNVKKSTTKFSRKQQIFELNQPSNSFTLGNLQLSVTAPFEGLFTR